MKKKLINPVYFLIVAIGIVMCLSACKKTFDIQPEVSLDFSNAYQNVSDADAAVMGIYSSLLDIGAQYVILNEVRADLMDVTNNADDNLRAINNHSNDVSAQTNLSTVSKGMSYADPKPFYKIVLNCNDVLKNLSIMRSKLLLNADQYNQRYSDVMAVRCWVYLQLAIHYGEVPYITKPFERIGDLKDSVNFQKVSLSIIDTVNKISLAPMIDSLVNCMKNLVYLDQYPTTATIMGLSSGTYNSTPFFINKRILLGDLYLWQGNYLQAATNYKIVLDSPGFDYQKYRLAYADVVYHQDLAVSYWQRYQMSDVNGLINSDIYGWRSIFCRTQDKYYYQEWIWQLFFDNANNSSSPFIELFANYGQGKYILKPSQQVYDMWNSQTQSNGFPYDGREKLSCATRNGQPIIMKYLYEYDELVPYKKPGRMFLYRATGLHLHFIEAANRDNKCKLALALLNRGIQYEFNPYQDPSQGKDTVANITEIERTDGAVYGYSYPYDFEGRQDGGAYNYTSHRISPKTGLDSAYTILITQYPVGVRDPWYQNAGVRGHAFVKPVLTSMYQTQTLVLDNSTALKDSIEKHVIEEDGLELAFEGERWADLLRVAIRKNDPSFLADKIYLKLLKAGNPNAVAVKNKLLNRQWFLPFSLK